MLKNFLSVAFIGLLISAVNPEVIAAQTNSDNSVESKKTEKIKAKVNRRGTGEKSEIVVKLKNGTKHKGYISQIIENSFDLTDSETRQITTIPFRDVRSFKKTGLSTGAKIAIGVGIAAVVTVIALRAAVKDAFGSFCPLGCRSILFSPD